MNPITSKKIQLFQKIKSYWPEYIDLSGSKLLQGGGLLSPELMNLYNDIEKKSENDVGLITIGCWSFHQALHAEALRLVEKSEIALATDSISFSAFNTRMAKNLSDAAWEEERDVYTNLT